MTEFPVDWVDAFTTQAFGGNGCAVVHGAAHLEAETCKAFVRETSLVECTFVGPSQTADFRVRYFLASGEIPFAGHPTIATAASLFHRGEIRLGETRFETQAGTVPVSLEIHGDALRIEMTQRAPTFGMHVPAGLVARVMRLDEADILAPPQIVSTGLPFCITPIRTKDALLRAQLNVDALAEMAALTGARPTEVGTDMMEPYLICPEGATEHGQTFGRLLMAPPSPPEDPFTGSATGAAAAYLYEYDLMKDPRWTAEQGHAMGRPGQAHVALHGPRGALTGVTVAGHAHVLMSGTLFL